MPGSGANLLWDETSPADSNNAGGGAGAIRSLETSLRNGLAVEHNWPNTTGANFGVHLFGSARAFYGPESNVSSSGTDGRLMVASDTSRFFHAGSNGTMLLGSSNLLEMGSSQLGSLGYGSQTIVWVLQSGVGITDGTASLAVTIPDGGYSGAPRVFVNVVASTATPFTICGNVLAGINGPVGNSAFTISTIQAGSAVSKPGIGVAWLSIGSKAL